MFQSKQKSCSNYFFHMKFIHCESGNYPLVAVQSVSTCCFLGIAASLTKVEKYKIWERCGVLWLVFYMLSYTALCSQCYTLSKVYLYRKLQNGIQDGIWHCKMKVVWIPEQAMSLLQTHKILAASWVRIQIVMRATWVELLRWKPKPVRLQLRKLANCEIRNKLLWLSSIRGMV